MVSKHRSLVKKEKESTAVKLKASDYVGLPNYYMIRWKIEHTIEKFEHRQKSLESGIDRKSVINLLCWKPQKTRRERVCFSLEKVASVRVTDCFLTRAVHCGP